MKVSYQGQEVNLPDFMMVGAAKSGTTTIYRILADHPDIYFPPSEKEPFYFCFGDKEPTQLNEITRNRVIWRTKDYVNLYENAGDVVLSGDASTAYLYKHDEVISNMEKLYGDALAKVKILILLRNPVDRAYSHYTFLVRNGFEDLEFEQAIRPEVVAARKEARWGFDYLDYGAYAEQVAHFQRRFPQTRVFLMEDLKQKQLMVNEITDFLSLERMEVGEDFRANPSGIPKNRFLVDQLRKNKVMKWMVNQLPEGAKHKMLNKRDNMMSKFLVKEPMRAETREMLKEHFAEDIMKLEAMIGRSLASWR